MKTSDAKIQKMFDAKAFKWLDTVVSDNVHGKIYRRQLLEREMVGKSKSVELYAKKKVNGCYSKLKTPKVEYYLHMSWKGEEYLMKCPSYVFDNVIAVDLTR